MRTECERDVDIFCWFWYCNFPPTAECNAMKWVQHLAFYMHFHFVSLSHVTNRICTPWADANEIHPCTEMILPPVEKYVYTVDARVMHIFAQSQCRNTRLEHFFIDYIVVQQLPSVFLTLLVRWRCHAQKHARAESPSFTSVRSWM